MRSHRPGRGHHSPVSTYRLQLTPDFGFTDAAGIVPYLADLGVTDLYLSPILESSAGSVHGYDVTSHARLSVEKGGRAGFDALVAAARAHGLHLIADVVPNHMTVATPLSHNAQFWSVLRDGEHSPHAHWFDVDWYTNEHHLLLPVLGAPLEKVLARGELTRGVGGPGGDEPVLRYFDHEFPIRPGSEHLPLPQILDAQAYRLAHWQAAEDELNYRRFFDVTALAGIRVEEPDVFFRTHALLLDLVDAGVLGGLRIDHPDGLADPGGYLARLARASGDVWVVAEKILEGDEGLPDSWACAGTTGYDALALVGSLFVDPAGIDTLTMTYAACTGDDVDLASVIRRSKRDVVAGVLEAEVGRLVRLLRWILPGADSQALTRVLAALLVSMDRYRIYVPRTGGPDDAARALLESLAVRARADLDPADHSTLDVVAALAAGDIPPAARPGSESAVGDFVTRFQQTCGPVMAKGIEDTAFYRHQRLVALNEVGGDPTHVGVTPAEFDETCQRRLARWPMTMTTLSTHDSKRSEDVRARQYALSEFPGEWADWVTRARDLATAHRGPRLDPSTEYRLWQEAVGAWPVTPDRLAAYAQKAVREAKRHTSWTRPDADYEADVDRFARGIVADPEVATHITDWLALTAEAARVSTLGQKLVQLTMPGVADTYQGTELLDLSLVDPDNRRPVDYADRRARLARLDGGAPPDDLDDELLLVTSAALRLRRDHPDWFVGIAATHGPLASTSDHLLAYTRGDLAGPGAVVLATRLWRTLHAAGAWGPATVDLPDGRWRDVLTGTVVDGGTRPVGAILTDLPVALLVRGDSHSG